MAQDISHWLGGKSFDDYKAGFDRNGYLIFKNVMSPDEVRAYRQALSPYLDQNISGRNDFEGLKTNRVYALMTKDPIFADMITHPLAMAFVEADLGKSCLLSSNLAINLHPGESVQPWHYDDAHIEIPRPRPSCGVSVFWALDDTTEDNGATEILPGSHVWPEGDFPGKLAMSAFADRNIRPPDDDPGAHPDGIKATMPAGSMMIAKGTLWHRGGANKSDQTRMIVTPQYCSGWARPLESMLLTMPPEQAAKLPVRAQELMGYSIHPPFMGYVDGVHPNKMLRKSKV